MKKLLQNNPRITAKEIRQKLNIQCCLMTIYKEIHKLKFINTFAKIKPKIKKDNLVKRVSFCESYKNWKVEDWSKVVFSDEVSIFFNRKCKHRIWRKRGSKVDKIHLDLRKRDYGSYYNFGAL